jgi:hypothetical protein
MKKFVYQTLLTLLAIGLCYFPALLTAHTLDADAGNLSGKWIGYYEDGTKSEYVWSIRQTGSTLSIENVGGKKAKSKGHVEGDKVVAEDFATQNGKLSEDGTKIKWSDGVVWKKVASAADLTGKWIGYYKDGSKSEYVWAIKQTGGTLSIENVGGKPAKSRGRVDGDKVLAQDFATQNGKLSADGTQITWTDGVVWKRQ